MFLLAMLVALVLPASASAVYLGPPYTTNDGVLQAATQWYPRCTGYLLEYGKIGSTPAPYGKWRNAQAVCQNTIEACATPWHYEYSWTNRRYEVRCGMVLRHFDAWCDGGGGNIRVRDLYHGWEKVTTIPCVRWY